jgi:hypothetical protein
MSKVDFKYLSKVGNRNYNTLDYIVIVISSSHFFNVAVYINILYIYTYNVNVYY